MTPKIRVCTHCGFVVTEKEYQDLVNYPTLIKIESPLLDHFNKEHPDGPAMALSDWLPRE